MIQSILYSWNSGFLNNDDIKKTINKGIFKVNKWNVDVFRAFKLRIIAIYRDAQVHWTSKAVGACLCRTDILLHETFITQKLNQSSYHHHTLGNVLSSLCLRKQTKKCLRMIRYVLIILPVGITLTKIYSNTFSALSSKLLLNEKTLKTDAMKDSSTVTRITHLRKMASEASFKQSPNTNTTASHASHACQRWRVKFLSN